MNGFAANPSHCSGNILAVFKSRGLHEELQTGKLSTGHDSGGQFIPASSNWPYRCPGEVSVGPLCIWPPAGAWPQSLRIRPRQDELAEAFQFLALARNSGQGEKLERFGKFVLSRPDPQALWPKRLDKAEWDKADAYFTRDADKADWSFRNKLPESWPVELGGLKFLVKPTAFKHTGLFPEQSVNWDWLRGLIQGKNDVEVLNLFGYTGGATLACAQAGAKSSI